MIGVFDSGYGGLTVLKEFVRSLPQYDYCYLSDNARAPYGNRSFETVYRYTLQSVRHLFDQGCRLIILACNTASAKALRNIQQRDLPRIAPDRRVLGVIRPCAEAIGAYTQTGHVGLLGTVGTVQSLSYPIEIGKLFPAIRLFQEPCPMLVPLVENNEHHSAGAAYFVRQYVDRLLRQSEDIDTIVLACTHYPLLMDEIRRCIKPHIHVIDQGPIVAESLRDYLERHPEMETTLSKNGRCIFQTTDVSELFERMASIFLEKEVYSQQVVLNEAI